MGVMPLNRRGFLRASRAAATGLVFAPALIGRAEAAALKLKCSSSLPNDPKYANGRVYYDNLVKSLKANGLGEQIEVTFFPDNQLGQEIDVINSVKLGVIGITPRGSSPCPCPRTPAGTSGTASRGPRLAPPAQPSRGGGSGPVHA